MIDFIVLGIVPGTSYQVQIVHIIIVAWVLFMGTLIKKQIRTAARIHKQEKQTERTA